MRVSRLYLPVPLKKGEKIELDIKNAHYLRTVLRLKKEAPITIFNGEGGEWKGIVTEAHRKGVILSIGEWVDRSVEASLRVSLGLAISRSDKMDWTVQKSVELGVTGISPLYTERCVVRLTADKQEQKQLHWQGIARHASEQCGRTRVPETDPIVKLERWLPVQTGLKIFLDPDASQSLSELSPRTTRFPEVTLLTGPEGGFADHERSSAKAAGFIPVRLGPRILRTETASIAALASVLTLWGDFQ